MTIQDFKQTNFTGNDIVVFDSKEYPVVSVDFKECLIGIDEYPDDEEDESIYWKRCENCELKR